MPASPIAARPGCKDSYQFAVRRHRAVYRMACQHHTVEDGCATVRCDYDLSGFEFLEAQIPSKPVLRSKRPWLSRLVGLGRTLLGVATMSLLDIGLQFVSRKIYLPWSEAPWQLNANARLLLVDMLVIGVAIWNERATAARNVEV